MSSLATSQKSSDIIIRKATKEDIPKVAEVLTYGFHRLNQWLWWLYPVLKMGIRDDLSQRASSPQNQYCCLIALQEQQKIVGTIELAVRTSYHWHGKKEYVYLSNLAVLPNYRRQGIASALLKKCEEVAVSWGFERLYLHVLAENETGKTVYLRNGYSVKQVDTDLYSLFVVGKRRWLLEKTW